MLAWVMLAAVLCAAALGGGVLSLTSFAGGTPDIVSLTVKAALCVLVAAAAGVGLFAFAAVRTPAAAPVALLAGSTVRMFVSLSLALVVYFTGGFDKPTGTGFWIVFLICGLAAIVAETAWGMKSLNRTTSNTPNTPTPAPAAETH